MNDDYLYYGLNGPNQFIYGKINVFNDDDLYYGLNRPKQLIYGEINVFNDDDVFYGPDWTKSINLRWNKWFKWWWCILWSI